MKKTLDESGLLRVAELVLPRLPPSDLAAAASSCKAFGREVASISSRRASDASRGVECHPIPFFNPTLDGQPYSFFLYTRVPVLPSSSMPLSARPWGGVDHPDKSRTLDDASSMSAFASPIAGSESGCGCKDCSFGGELGICPCLSPEEGAFLASGPGMELMLECGANCSCGDECLNRSTQRGVSVKLRIVKDEKKGWGLHAAQFIARGQFVCEYAAQIMLRACLSDKRLADAEINAAGVAERVVAYSRPPTLTICLTRLEGHMRWLARVERVRRRLAMLWLLQQTCLPNDLPCCRSRCSRSRPHQASL
ncbi:histone-lysine N-methyltransferase SUVR3-like isoform X2 [Zingiber officinale]|uniref:histone-lysine N-methyltransferase SUVR3-like isoform X2 n=1 Tax=Zingiber officinale TaxID=94328 RepID=UPI001C4B9B0B|nr:histone-lysine N-methyltransferase SUVR3-like isoform X2 [Zingiber officinale]